MNNYKTNNPLFEILNEVEEFIESSSARTVCELYDLISSHFHVTTNYAIEAVNFIINNNADISRAESMYC